MALILENKPNTMPFNAIYPYGNILDDTGAGDGTPVDQNVYADFHQFFARLIDQASNPAIIINDQPENAVNGFQFYEALLATETTLALANEVKADANAVNIQKLFALLDVGDFSPFTTF